MIDTEDLYNIEDLTKKAFLEMLSNPKCIYCQGKGVFTDITLNPICECAPSAESNQPKRPFVSNQPKPRLKDDADKPAMHLVPWGVVCDIAAVLTHGAEKYTPWGWQNASDSDTVRYLDATLRHLAAECDSMGARDTSGLRALDHALASLMIYAALRRSQRESGADDAE